jgi:uncharacterized Zn finger protein
MQEIVFKVKGSAIDPYIVRFVNSGDDQITAFCSCPAGINGQYCKHRFSIMRGQLKSVVSGGDTEVGIVHQWLDGTKLREAFLEMDALQVEADRVNRSLARVKKAVSQIMRGQG